VSAATEEDKDGAHTAVSLAVREGRLPPLGTCLLCDQPAAARHHWSYLPEHWLDVVQLCHKHHADVHCGRIPEPTTGKRLKREPKPRKQGPEEMWRRRLYADRLRNRRDELGLTQDEAAARLGMTGAGWSNIETGKTSPGTAQIEDAFAALGLRVEFGLVRAEPGDSRDPVLHDPLFAALGPMGTLVVAVAFGLTAGAVGAVVLGGDR